MDSRIGAIERRLPMDCEKCKHKFEPVWTPPVARHKPNTPLPDGAVCVDGGSVEVMWVRDGRIWHVCVGGYSRVLPIAEADIFAKHVRALGLPVWGVDINCGGECAEEFWTDGECHRHSLSDTHVAGNEVALPLYPFYPRCATRPVTLCRRYHGTRKDGVSVDGWIVKPVAVEQPKPAPGQPCPACGQPVPEPMPPAPFKVGDWVKRECDAIAYEVKSLQLRAGAWECLLVTSWCQCADYTILRPALPPLPGEIKDWVVAGIRPTGDIPSNRFVARFLRDLYPHEFGGE
jgi:hypothetical protein